MKNLYLVSNDKIWSSKKSYTSNNDLDSIISCLDKDYNIYILNRKSQKKLNFLIKSKFIFCNMKKIKEKKINLLMISISPYNFFTFLRLIFINKADVRGYVYLRSDGFLEYKYRYGIFGYYFYYLMFKFISQKLKILSCSNYFKHVKVRNILHPSELNSIWLKKKKINSNFKTDFLYVGRFKKDKGAFYLSKIFKYHLNNFKLTIVGTEKKLINHKYYSNNIKYLGSISNVKKLIKIYDTSKIFILPSYIEGFPKVISESLSRLKPIIIFDDIKYVVNNRSGIFVCKRNISSLKKKIDFILRNYKNIQSKIKKNYFYTKDNFKKELLSYIKNEF